jgi:hypothetical protein
MKKLIIISLIAFTSCKKEKCFECDYFHSTGQFISTQTLCTDETYQTKKELEMKYTNENFYARCK